MISGEVDAWRQAIIQLVVLGFNGREHEITTVIDIGYTGFLTLPPDLVAALELPFRSRGRALLGDGSETIFDVHEAVVLWDGNRRTIFIDVAETDPLTGMSLLAGYDLTVQVVAGGNVRITAIGAFGE